MAPVESERLWLAGSCPIWCSKHSEKTMTLAPNSQTLSRCKWWVIRSMTRRKTRSIILPELKFSKLLKLFPVNLPADVAERQIWGSSAVGLNCLTALLSLLLLNQGDVDELDVGDEVVQIRE